MCLDHPAARRSERVQSLICKLGDLPQRERLRRSVVRPLEQLVSSKDPSVLIARRRCTPIPECREAQLCASARRQCDDSVLDSRRRRQEWYLRRCYVRELQIIQGRSPDLQLVSGAPPMDFIVECTGVDTPRSFAS